MKKHISYRSAELLTALNSKNQSYFTIEDARKILPESGEWAVRKLLSSMSKRTLILRLKDGLYNIIPYEKSINDYYPNWHLVAEKLVYPEEYYIGFYSALDIHGLITQPSLVEQVVTKKQFSPQTRVIKNVRYQFVTLGEERFFGFQKTWIDDFSKVWCSDLEKTIIDCLYMPKYANGITEIIKAIYQCKDKINVDKMQKYLDKYETEVVLKRLGFILEHLGIFNSIGDYIQDRLSKSYAVLDPSSPHKGKHYAKWKIIDNIDIKSSLKSLET
jgi:predicted transcriptional regulator of viral defense system